MFWFKISFAFVFSHPLFIVHLFRLIGYSSLINFPFVNFHRFVSSCALFFVRFSWLVYFSLIIYCPFFLIGSFSCAFFCLPLLGSLSDSFFCFVRFLSFVCFSFELSRSFLGQFNSIVLCYTFIYGLLFCVLLLLNFVYHS